MYKKILVPLDGSDLAEAVLRHAEQLAAKFGASLLLLRVIEPPTFAPLVASSRAPVAHPAGVVDAAALREASRQEAERYLSKLTEAPAERRISVFHEHREGEPAHEIALRAQELPADLIAITTHGRGGLGRMIFGSVADAVTRNSRSAVLVVPVSPR
jgi:nucleotide-binding universal stress UspA family protein